MKDTAEFMDQKIAACDKLYSTKQRDLLKCYRYIGHPYGLDEEIKICTEEYKTLSQLSDLYECMKEFGVEKNEEYCNLSPSYSQFVDETDYDPEGLKGHYYIDENLSSEPYFQCVLDNTEHTKTDARKCVEVLVMYRILKSFGMEVEELDFAEMKNCFSEQDMPLGGASTKICEIQYLDTQKSGFVTTGKKCETDEQYDTNDNCFYYDWVFEDEYDECQLYYEDLY